MIVSGFLFYTLFVQQNIQYNNLRDDIFELKTSTQSQINSLSDNILQTQQDLQLSIEESQNQIDLLKASAGEDFSGIIENSIESVVTIRTSSGQGTGFIIDNGGYIVTNAHVIADENGYLAQNIRAITYDSGTKNAEFIGYNGTLDVALLKIEGNYKSLEFGNSDDLSVGTKVIAIGNPLGLQFSVSEGIISAIHRPGSNNLNAYIQTDASLNPGNSGGPLIDKNGKVIGINNFKITNGENLGFALESNYIILAVNEISQTQLNETLIG